MNGGIDERFNRICQTLIDPSSNSMQRERERERERESTQFHRGISFTENNVHLHLLPSSSFFLAKLARDTIDAFRIHELSE